MKRIIYVLTDCKYLSLSLLALAICEFDTGGAAGGGADAVVTGRLTSGGAGWGGLDREGEGREAGGNWLVVVLLLGAVVVLVLCADVVLFVLVG